MSPSRSGLTGLTLAIGLGVAVTTSQGTAIADPADPAAPSSDTTAAAADPTPEDDTAPGSDGGPQQAEPAVNEPPASSVEATSITIRRPDDADPSTEQEPPQVDENASPPAVTDPKPTHIAQHEVNDAHPAVVDTPRAVARVADTDSPAAVTASHRKAASSPEPQAEPTRVVVAAPTALNPAPTALAAAVAPGPVQAAPATSFLSGLFGLFGVNALAGDPARPLFPIANLIEMAFVAIRRTFFNQAPTARLDTSSLEVNPDTGGATGRILAADADGDGLVYKVASAPVQGGTVDVTSDGLFTYRPPDGWAHDDGGTVDFTIAVSDDTYPHLHLFDRGSLFGAGHDATVRVTYTVAAVNHAPVVTVLSESVQPGGNVLYTVRTSDRDRDDVTLTTSTVNGALTGGQTGVDAVTGDRTYAFTFTPDADYAHELTEGGATASGQGSVTFTATDDLGAVGTPVTRTIAIAAVNREPVMTVTAGAGGLYTIEVTDEDGDDVDLLATATNGTLTGGATATPGHYVYTFTVDEDWRHTLTLPGGTGTGTATVGFAVTDGHGGRDDFTQSITVTGVNSAPTVSVVHDNGVYTVTVRDDDAGDVVTLTPRAVNGTLVGGPTATGGGVRVPVRRRPVVRARSDAARSARNRFGDCAVRGYRRPSGHERDLQQGLHGRRPEQCADGVGGARQRGVHGDGA